MVSEPSVVAVNEKTGQVVAVGATAKEMLGRTPTHITAVRPLVDGVISDFEMTEEMLHMAQLCNQCCIGLKNAVGTLKDISDPEVAKAALKTCDEIDHLESDADRLLSTAITRLFREDIEVRELIKLQRIYELLE